MSLLYQPLQETCPKEVPHYKNDWTTTSDFFKKLYNWREQESSYEKMMNNYKVEKAINDAFWKEKNSRSLQSKVK
jgi:hypothetical protein